MADQEEKPKMTPEMMKNNQELAAQAALRAQQIMFRKSIGSTVSAENSPQASPSPSKKSMPPVVPARGDSVLSKQPPKIPPKRHSMQANAVQGAPMRPGPPVQSSPLKKPMAPPPLPAPLTASHELMQKAKPLANNSPQMTRIGPIRNDSIGAIGPPNRGTPIPPTPPPKKPVSPIEDFSSEDALRGIESGLRNMERAMQEQMNMNMNMNMRSAEHAKQTEKMNFNPVRSMERGFSMDQMRLDAKNLGSMRSTLAEMKNKGFVDMNPMVPSNAPNARPMEIHMKSLDRNLPLELQYSRHHHHNLTNAASGAVAMLSNARQSGAAISRDDVRLRRRSSHDENQMAQSQANAAGKMRIKLLIHFSLRDTNPHIYYAYPTLFKPTLNVFFYFFLSSQSFTGTLGRNFTECSTAKITINSNAGRLSKVSHAQQTPHLNSFYSLQISNSLLIHRYEAKRCEIETWLQRMEIRLEQMGGKIGSTADVLEAQQKEQKVSVSVAWTTPITRISRLSTVISCRIAPV